jgi:hypothetical protein
VDELIRRVDDIPWQVIALAGLIGFLTLIRYVHIQTNGEVGR